MIYYTRDYVRVIYHKTGANEDNKSLKIRVSNVNRKNKRKTSFSRIASNKVEIQGEYHEKLKTNIRITLKPYNIGNIKYSDNTI